MMRVASRKHNDHCHNFGIVPAPALCIPVFDHQQCSLPRYIQWPACFACTFHPSFATRLAAALRIVFLKLCAIVDSILFFCVRCLFWLEHKQ